MSIALTGKTFTRQFLHNPTNLKYITTKSITKSRETNVSAEGFYMSV